MATKDEKIVLYGATGNTGELVARELVRRGILPVLGGRSEEKLSALAEELGLEYRAAAVDDGPGLNELISGAAVVISCAGPFVDVGRPVAEAAIRHGAHYVDTTGEQAYMRVLSEELSGEAKEKGVVLLPACAFEFALGDLAAEIGWVQGASRIAVAYVVDDFTMSQGTKKSLVRSFGEKGLTFVDGELQEKRVGYRLFDVPLPGGEKRKAAWVPGGEALTVPPRGGVSRVETCIAAGDGAAFLVGTLSGVLPSVLRMMQPLADKVVERGEGPPREVAEEEVFYVVAFDPKDGKAYATIRGLDIYGVTARVVSESVEYLCREEPKKKGFVGAADLFDAEEFLESVGVELLEKEER